MRNLQHLLAIGTLATTLAFGQAGTTTQQNADEAARAAQSGKPVTNPGYGQQVPNDATQSGGVPQSNSSYQKDRNGSQGFDLGWLGLLGLIGLFGLNRKRGHLEDPVGNPTRTDVHPARS